MRSPILFSILALVAFGAYIKLPKHCGFTFGFFVGIFWFYWISLSFRYYDLWYLMPLVVAGIGIIYGLIFALLALFTNYIFRALSLLALSFISPFGFDWLVPEVMLSVSYFGSSKADFTLVLVAILLLIYTPRFFKIISLLPLYFALYSTPQAETLPFNIELVQTNIPQDIRWDKEAKAKIIEENLRQIDAAIIAKKSLILFPETAFPLALNHDEWLLEYLMQKSHKIAIITGSLRLSERKVYNSTYYFWRGKMEVADKIVLVPFGEKIPLPEFIAKPINRIFFGGAEDYVGGDGAPVDFIFDDVRLRSAICYEATSTLLYHDSPRFMVAISNNAWFYKSTEPTLQRLLLGHYSRKHGTTILHSANRSKSEIIHP